MSTWTYKVKYTELVKFEGSEEDDMGVVETLTVLADDAEEAIAKVRKGVVGQPRTIQPDEENPNGFKGVVTDLQINTAERGDFVDIE